MHTGGGLAKVYYLGRIGRFHRPGRIACPNVLGPAAAAAVRYGEPLDAVVMDMEMPVLDDYEATRILWERGFSNPIIAVTAYAMSEDRDECLAAGRDDHVSKPIKWYRLLSKLSQRLASAQETSIS